MQRRMMERAERARGVFLAVEGPDGVGKSTLVEALVRRLELEAGRSVLRLREPGSTPLGERVRAIVKGEAGPLGPEAELFLFCAARAQMISEVVRPALDAGQVVIADRFALSTYAYQGGPGRVSDERIRAVLEVAVGDVWPDLTLVLSLSPDVLRERLDARGGERDRIEADQARLDSAMRRYHDLAPHVPGARPLSADGTPDEVLERAWHLVASVVAPQRCGPGRERIARTGGAPVVVRGGRSR
jgi:dTMP kinase